jgi:hypothetical protein
MRKKVRLPVSEKLSNVNQAAVPVFLHEGAQPSQPYTLNIPAIHEEEGAAARQSEVEQRELGGGAGDPA